MSQLADFQRLQEELKDEYLGLIDSKTLQKIYERKYLEYIEV